MTSNEPARVLRLPLTEPPQAAQARPSGITPEMIASIVDDFYARCRSHPVLGPIFEAQIDEWDAHLARIRAFWGSAILRTGGYAGRPLEAHLAIPNLAPEHFSLWLRLFSDTVGAHCVSEDAAIFMSLAGRMANRLMSAGGISRRLMNE